MMKTSRRTFLRVLGSALVAAVAAPALPLVDSVPEISVPIPGVVIWPTGPWFKAGGAMDRLAVRSMARRQTLARETGLLYDVELAA